MFDLCTDLGHMGQLYHPDVVAAFDRAEGAAQTVGAPLGRLAFSENQVSSLTARGYRVVLGFDLISLRAQAAALAGWARS